MKAKAHPNTRRALRERLLKAQRRHAAKTPSGTDQTRFLTLAARSAARAYDEVFALRHELAVAKSARQAETPADVDALQMQVVALQAELTARPPATTDDPRLQAELEEQRRRADHFEGYCNALLASTSWRITGPLRTVVTFFRRG